MKTLLVLTMLAFSAAANAQFLSGVRIEPSPPLAGSKAVITAGFDVKDGVINCGVRVRFSDGTPGKYYRINQEKDTPLRIEHVFAAAGEYMVWIEPRTKLPSLKCGGGDLSLKITVTPPAW